MENTNTRPTFYRKLLSANPNMSHIAQPTARPILYMCVKNTPSYGRLLAASLHS